MDIGSRKSPLAAGSLLCIVALFYCLVAQSQASRDWLDLTLPKLKTSDKWQPGIDYIVLADAKTDGGYVPAGSMFTDLRARPGKVIVTYFFQYTWGPAFERKLQAWCTGQPDIQFVHRPSVGWTHTRYFAQLHYALKALGHDEDLHFKLYDWIGADVRYSLYHGDPLRPDVAAIERLNLEFVRANGINTEAFLAAYRSSEVIYETNLAAKESHTAGSAGNPGDASIVVAGKYGTSLMRVCHRELNAEQPCPDGEQRLFKLIRYLASDEIARRKQS